VSGDCLALSPDELRVLQLEEQLRVERARAAMLEQLAMGAAFDAGRRARELETALELWLAWYRMPGDAPLHRRIGARVDAAHASWHVLGLIR
jgi:hypothetical protein